jgi:hypothetical protein
MAYFTKQISNDTFLFDRNTGVNNICVILISGTGSISGTEKANNLNSSPIQMTLGTPISLTKTQPFPNGSLTFDFSSGTVMILGS